MQCCVFLDRDGVINKEKGGYTFEKKDFELIAGVRESLMRLKKHRFLLIVITNQGGISRGLYTEAQMEDCHSYMQEVLGNVIDAIFYSSGHPSVSASMLRKPSPYWFAYAIRKYAIQIKGSWMVGDRERDLIPAKALGLKAIQVGKHARSVYADHMVEDLKTAVDRYILPMEKEKHR